MSIHPLETLESAHAELLDRRARLATIIGVPLYALDAIEPWFEFHDPITAGIQLFVSFLLLCLAGLSFTPWGTQRKLALFTFGFLLAVTGFESIVCYKEAFGTSYSAGFATCFAYYCVFIPATVFTSSMVGIAIVALTSIPEVLITGEIGRFGSALVSDALSFVVLVYGRHIGNTLWASEFATSRRHSEFVSAVSHEFRSPVTSLCSLTRQLADGKLSNKSDRFECYRMMAGESQRLRWLVEGLLNFACMDAGVFKYRFKDIDAAELLLEVTDEFRLYAEPRGYEVEVRVSCDPALVNADRVTLTSVIWNLLDNAVKYSPESRTVWADVGTRDGRVAIRIRDQGLGIPAEEQEQIFGKFVRGRNGTENGAIPGMGVGLYVAALIVAAHSGEITLESKVGQGSTFVVLLPSVGQR